jgi:nicotinate-nucleotide adenylyltransferase
MREGGAVRVGILGGTFDPIHVGHLETARAAQRALGLTRILVMPSRVPPHRTAGPSASPFHRFAMAALAVPDVPDAVVLDAELTTAGPSYTASTLERLTVEGLRRPELFFITGADAFAEIETWYRYPEVLDLAHFVVISRPGMPAGSVPARLPDLAGRFRTADHDTRADGMPRIFLVDAPTPDVSSTEIRRRLRRAESITGLVPGPVEEHIRRHRLYVDLNTADQWR